MPESPQLRTQVVTSAVNPFRLTRSLLFAAAALLAGCANTSDPSSAYASSDAERNRYLSRTQADPLGAYLASRDIIKALPQNASSTLADTALTMLGTKYRFGGKGPSTGFDCSGLVA